jgi:glycogen operon protein
MTEEHWNNDFAKSLAIYLNGRGLHTVGPKGEHVVDDNFFLIFNAHHEPLEFTLPRSKYGKQWQKVLDTSHPDHEEETYLAKETIMTEGRSIIVLKHPLVYGQL